MKNSLLFLALGCVFTLNAQISDNEIVQVTQKRNLAEYEIAVFPNPSSTWMISIVKKSKLSYFSYYCLIVGTLAIGWGLIN